MPPKRADDWQAICESGSNDDPRPWVLRASEGMSRGRAEVVPNTLAEMGYCYTGAKAGGGFTLREPHVSSAPE